MNFEGISKGLLSRNSKIKLYATKLCNCINTGKCLALETKPSIKNYNPYILVCYNYSQYYKCIIVVYKHIYLYYYFVDIIY